MKRISNFIVRLNHRTEMSKKNEQSRIDPSLLFVCCAWKIKGNKFVSRKTPFLFLKFNPLKKQCLFTLDFRMTEGGTTATRLILSLDPT